MTQITDFARRLLRLQSARSRDKPGAIPRMGRYIHLNNRYRMHVTGNATTEFWGWLTLIGWREIRFARDRRTYIDLPERSFMELFRRDPSKREPLYEKLLERMTAEPKAADRLSA